LNDWNGVKRLNDLNHLNKSWSLWLVKSCGAVVAAVNDFELMNLKSIQITAGKLFVRQDVFRCVILFDTMHCAKDDLCITFSSIG
jgi:hypothetical protein